MSDQLREQPVEPSTSFQERLAEWIAESLEIALPERFAVSEELRKGMAAAMATGLLPFIQQRVEAAYEFGTQYVGPKDQLKFGALDRLLEAARAEEREVCAKIADSCWSDVASRGTCSYAAEAIRKRGAL